jgi:hypothetical protein
MSHREARKVLEREINLARTSTDGGDDRRVSELTNRLNRLDQ